MTMKQAELSQRFYKKQKLQKLATKILENWQKNPNSHHSLQDVKYHIDRICELPRKWNDADYENAVQQLSDFGLELRTASIPITNIPKLTDLIIASLNMVNASSIDKGGALIDAFYRTQGFNALEELSEYLNGVIKQEHERQTVTASFQGYYDPRQIPASGNATQIPLKKDNFRL